MEERLARLAKIMDEGRELEETWFTQPKSDTFREFIRCAPRIDKWYAQSHSLQGIARDIRGWSPGGRDFLTIEDEQGKEYDEANRAWLRLRRQPPQKLEDLQPFVVLLKYLGFDFKCDPDDALQVVSRDQNWLLLNTTGVFASLPVRPIPQFGSQSAGKYSVLCFWERLGAHAIFSRLRELHLTASNILMLYVGGRLKDRQKRGIIHSCRERDLTLATLDEELLLFLATKEREERFSCFLQCALPLTLVTIQVEKLRSLGCESMLCQVSAIMVPSETQDPGLCRSLREVRVAPWEAQLTETQARVAARERPGGGHRRHRPRPRRSGGRSRAGRVCGLWSGVDRGRGSRLWWSICRRAAVPWQPVGERRRQWGGQAAAVKHRDETGRRVEGGLPWMHVARPSEGAGWGRGAHSGTGLRAAWCTIAGSPAAGWRECAMPCATPLSCGLCRPWWTMTRMTRNRGRRHGADPCRRGGGRGSGSAAVPGWTRPWPTMRRCLTDPAVPFTNNRAEQDLRVLTVRQKVSGGFRTRQGAEDDALWRSVVTTARKQGWDLRPAWTRSAAQFRADLTSGMQARDAPA